MNKIIKNALVLMAFSLVLGFVLGAVYKITAKAIIREMVNLFTNVYIYLGTRWHNHTGSVTEFWKYARLLNMVSVTCIISIPAHLFKRGGHFVERFLQFCCRWRRNRAKSRGFARSGALGQPGAGHGLAGGVLFSLFYEINYIYDFFEKYQQFPSLEN